MLTIWLLGMVLFGFAAMVDGAALGGLLVGLGERHPDSFAFAFGWTAICWMVSLMVDD